MDSDADLGFEPCNQAQFHESYRERYPVMCALLFAVDYWPSLALGSVGSGCPEEDDADSMRYAMAFYGETHYWSDPVRSQ
jgi:hypothetical protein